MKNAVTQKSKVQTSDSPTPLRKFVTCGVLSLFLLVSPASNAQEACITVDIYGGFEASGGGAPYSDLVGTFNATSVSFATDNGFDWHPFGLFEFGADIRGCLNVAADGEYTFTLDSDDGSLLFIDGNLVVDNGETHPPQTGSGSATLTAGLHTFEIQFYECCGGPSGVDLILPEGVSYTCCPKPRGVCVDEVTAGGWVEEGTDAFANFGLNAREKTRGRVTKLTGELNFVDADMDCHVVGHEVLEYTEIDEFCREIVYDVTLSLFEVPQAGEFIAVVEVCDFGEPSTEDTFSIEVFDVTDPLNPVLVETCSASGVLAGGNVQVHESGNCP